MGNNFGGKMIDVSRSLKMSSSPVNVLEVARLVEEPENTALLVEICGKYLFEWLDLTSSYIRTKQKQ